MLLLPKYGVRESPVPSGVTTDSESSVPTFALSAGLGTLVDLGWCSDTSTVLGFALSAEVGTLVDSLPN